jgi:hypothetical protein
MQPLVARFTRSAFVLALTCASTLAHAQEIPGAYTNPSGLTASAHGGVLLRAAPMWREADGTIIALSEETTGVYENLNLLGIRQVAPQCWSDATVPATMLRSLVTVPLPSEVDRWSLAASPTEVIALRSTRATDGTRTLTLYRASCSGDSTELGQVVLPRHPTADLGVGNQINAWPVVDGVIYLVTSTRQLLRIDSATLTTSFVELGGDDVHAVGLVPSGALWIVGGTTTRRIWAFDGSTSTATSVMADRPFGVDQVLAAPGLGGVFLGESGIAPNPTTTMALLAIEPEDDAFGWTGVIPPWPLLEGFDHDGFIGSADGTVWARHWHDFVGNTNQNGRRYSLRAVGIDPVNADFDADGLGRAHEAALGTSDRLRDSDGDGFDDRYEVQRKTNPNDGASHPPVTPTEPVIVAQSVFPVYPVSDKPCRFAPPQPGEPADLCAAVPLHGPSRDLTPDGRWLFAGGDLGVNGLPTTLDVYDTTDGSHTPFIEESLRAAAITGFTSGQNWAIARDAMGFVSNDRGAVLFTAGRALRFIDVERHGCPIVRDEAELAACVPGEPRNEGHAVRAVGVVGDMLVVRYDDRYVGASSAGVFDLGDLTTTSDGLELTNIVMLPDGHGFMGQAQGYVGDGNGLRARFYAASFLYDAHLRRMGDLPYVGSLDPLGAWDGIGYSFNQQSLFFKRIFIPAPCDTNPWAFDPQCGTVAGNPIVERRLPLSVDFRVTPEAIEPGEVIMASEHTYVRPPPNQGGLPLSVLARNEDGVYAAFEQDDAIWRLWRLTKAGSIVVWLSATMFADHTDTTGREAIATTPLGATKALRASPDGRRLCLTESGRAWELTLVGGVLETVSLVSNDARACAYADDGRLALLNATSISVGGATLPVSGDPIELVRTVGGWLVNDNESAACVLDDGTRVALDVKLVGISEAALAGPGAVMTIDDQGMAWVGTDPCHGKLREELLHDGYLWSWLYGDMLGMVMPKETHDAFAQRPDGSFVVSGGTLEIFPAKLLWWLQPAYKPLSKASRVVALDPFRQGTANKTLMSQYLTEVSAMTVIPGGDPSGYWGHAPLIPYPVPDDVPNPDDPDPDPDPVGPDDSDPKGADDGCAGGGLDLGLAFLGLVICRHFARRRKVTLRVLV